MLNYFFCDYILSLWFVSYLEFDYNLEEKNNNSELLNKIIEPSFNYASLKNEIDIDIDDDIDIDYNFDHKDKHYRNFHFDDDHIDIDDIDDLDVVCFEEDNGDEDDIVCFNNDYDDIYNLDIDDVIF
jgi:hypothetical protein